MPQRSRDDFSPKMIEALAKRASYICSNPDCRCLTLCPSTEDDEKYIYIGKAAHITAASEGGPRGFVTACPSCECSDGQQFCCALVARPLGDLKRD